MRLFTAAVPPPEVADHLAAALAGVPDLTIGKGRVTALGYHGPEWTVDEVVLLRAGERYEYTLVDRVRLS